MAERKLSLLVLSEYYPKPHLPAFGIFVKRQVDELARRCDVVVVSPVRVFPPLRLFGALVGLRPRRFAEEARAWLADVVGLPRRRTVDGVEVHHPRYTSGPNQVLHPSVGFFAWFFLRRGLLALHRRHRFDIVHAHYAVPCGTLAARFSASAGVPAVLSIHGRDFTYTARKGRINRRLLRDIFNGVDAVCANSGWTVRRLVEAGASPERVRLVELGAIEVKEEPPRVRRSGRLRVLSAGYLIPRKKFDLTIRATARAIADGADLELEIVGEGPERERLERLAGRVAPEGRVRFTGYVAPERMVDHFDAADIFALPSVDEAFGLVYVEALARGVPPIGCRGEGGPEDLAAKGDCIVLVEPNDVASLAAALSRLHDDPEMRLRLAEAGRGIVRDHYTWRRNAERTMALYRELIEGRGRAASPA